MDGESKIIIDENDLAYGVNVKNASWKFNDKSSEDVDITWDNVFFGGSCLFNKVVVYYEPVNAGAESGSVEVKNLKGENGSVTLENLETNVEYKIYIQAYHTNGLISSKDPLEGTITTKVVVAGISITPSSLESAIEIEGKAELTATVTPENASDKSVTWTFDEEAFSADSDTSDSGVAKSFTAKKAGVFTIAAKTNDELATSVDPAKIKVKVNPAAPTVEKKSDNITVNWEAVSNEDATYTLYRKADSADAQVIGTQNMKVTRYEDKDIFSGVTYSYYVVATVGEDTLTSKTSSEVDMFESVIGITLPSKGESLDINLRSEDGILALTDKNSITLSAVDKDGYPLEGYTYAWYVDLGSDPISNSSTLVLNMEEHGQYFYPVVVEHEITLELTKGERTYSGSVTVHVLSGDVPAESIAISLPEGQATRLSTVDADGNLRKIPLTTVVTPNYTTEKVTYNVDVVEGTTTDQPADIVAVEDGFIVFKGGTGDVRITASTPSKTSNVIELSIYKATVNSVSQLLNAMNDLMYQEFNKANSDFEGDWWAGSGGSIYGRSSNGTGIGFTFNAGDSSNREGGRLSINVQSYNLQEENGNLDIGLVSIQTSSEIQFKAKDNWTYLGEQALEAIGINGGGKMNVSLPFNQGTVSIVYDNIVVDNGGTNRGGYYRVTFNKVLGTDGSLEANKEYVIEDSASCGINKILYR